MADRYFHDGPLAPGPVTLAGPEAHHLAVVCRASPGTDVVLFNGDGREYPAVVVAADRKRATLEVLRAEEPRRELGFRLELAVALPKGDRGDFLVEKLTELGATDLVPLVTRRGVVQPKDARLDNLRRAVIEASKQCGRNTLMRVAPLTPWADYLAGDRPAGRLVAHPYGEVRPAAELARVPAGLTVAVGPEGGLTDEEVAAAVAAGWRPVGLGPRILRVETAAVALAAIAAAGPSGVHA
jgi:16S rRNA (uracil1498-N3)-methyltransferase